MYNIENYSLSFSGMLKPGDAVGLDIFWSENDFYKTVGRDVFESFLRYLKKCADRDNGLTSNPAAVRCYYNEYRSWALKNGFTSVAVPEASA